MFLRLGEVLSDDLSGLRGDSVREAYRELHDEVTALRRVLRERKALPSETLERPWLDDVVTGQRDDAVFQRGNTESAATQRLEGERTHGGLISLERMTCQRHKYCSDLMFP